MNKILIFLLFFIIILPAHICLARENPFFSKTIPDKIKQNPVSMYPGCIQELLNSINILQREININLSTLSRKINEEKDFALFFLLLSFAFLFGFIHALGPGHGKIIIVSYALSNPLKIKQGIALSIFIAVIHTISAILLVSILYFILKSTYSGYSQEPKRIITLVSYGAIAGMGIFLLVKTIVIDILRLKINNNNPEIKPEINQNRIKNLILPALIIGVVPCEGAVLILIFAISINSYWLGIILTIAMSIGMALTISIIGIIIIYSKKGVLKLMPVQPGVTKIMSITIQILGGIIILIFGLLLFLSKIV